MASDAEAVWRIHSDVRTNVHNPVGAMRERAAADDLVATWMDDWATYGVGYWAVTTLEDRDEVIGFSGIRRIAWHDRDVYNLYYRFAPEAWGHGYAGEAAAAAVAHWRTLTPRLPLLARTLAGNIASQRTAARAGLLRRPDLDGTVDGIPEVISALGPI